MPASRYCVMCLGALVLTACPGPRNEDAREPNDSFDQATPLILEERIEGRVNEDNPDVFVVNAPAGTQQLRFELEHLSHERCPVFSVHDPQRQEMVGQDLTGECNFMLEQTRLIQGAAVEPLDDGGYVITVPVTEEGEHFLTIREDTVADNIAPFSWDYAVTALAEP